MFIFENKKQKVIKMGNTFINTPDYEKFSFSFTLKENIMFR